MARVVRKNRVRQHSVQIYFLEAEHAALCELATRRGMPFGTWARDRLLSELPASTRAKVSRPPRR